MLGALDMGGGVCWAASACSLATPWTLGGFVAFTTARMAYEHRDFLRVASRKLRKKVQSRARRVRRKVRVKMGRMTGRLRRFLKRREIRRPQSPPMQTLPSSPTPQ